MPPPFDEEGADGLLGDEDLLADEEDELWEPVGEDGRPGFRASLFSSQAPQYARFRPTYPEEVYRAIFDFAAAAQGYQPGRNSNELALDIGCGPGNVAIELAKTYAQVIGVDPSQSQLDHAHQRPNVRYLCSAAEYLSEHLPPQSVDLIAMAETLHWLDHVQFYEQARWVLKPTGTVAIWCYDLCEFSPCSPHQTQAGLDQANALMRAFTYSVMGPFWDGRRVYIDRHYAGLEPHPYQFRTCVRQDSSMDHVMSLDHYMGFLSSWSPYAAYRTTYPNREDPLIELKAQFKQLLSVKDDAAPELRVTWPLFFLLLRDPVQ